MTEHDIDVLLDDGVEADEDLPVWLHTVALAALRAAGLEASELCVRLVDDDEMAEINGQWRNKPEPTDVLSFPQQEPPVRGGLLGDLVVSLPTARRQAEEVGHELRSELCVLLVHGVAHLLGHDHHEPVEAAAMAALEAELLAIVAPEVGVGLVVRGGAAG